MRDTRIDVARGLLIAGVVVGHLLERTSDWEGGVQRFALIALYAMHMPAFVFLTGRLASPRNLLRKTLGLVAILVVFQAVYVAFLALLGHPLTQWYWPYWVLWYIMALLLWQLLVPAITRWPVPSFVLSCVLAVVIGLAPWHGNWFSYQRAAAFLPFFVLGCAWGRQLLDFAQSRHLMIKLGAVVVFVVAVVGLYVLEPEPHWLFHNWNYGQLRVDAATGIAAQSGVLAIGAVGTFAFLSLIPRRAAPISWLGERTLPVFVVHVFAVLAFDWWFVDLIRDWPARAVLGLDIVLGIGIAYLFATKPFVTLTTTIRRLPERWAPKTRT